MAGFYIIHIQKNSVTSWDEVKQKMDKAIDWYRINQQTWVVYTTSGWRKWCKRLLPLAEPDGMLFVCKLDIQKHNGWMPQKFWEWLREKEEWLKEQEGQL